MLRNRKYAQKREMPYNERIRRYNEEKQSAMKLASNRDEAERIIYILRTKWGV